MATLGDIIKVYVKPSMDGRLIIRKRGVNRTSANVIAVNRKFANAKLASSCKGLKWKKFVSCLREQAQKKGLTK